MVLIGCVPMDAPRGGYIPPNVPKCGSCQTPLIVGSRSAALLRSRPDEYALVCIPCLHALMELDADDDAPPDCQECGNHQATERLWLCRECLYRLDAPYRRAWEKGKRRPGNGPTIPAELD